MCHKLFLAFALAVLVACKGHLPIGPSGPEPSPSPTPPPSTRITEPLRTRGEQFVPPILGSIICCSDGVDEHRWPQFDPATVDEIAAAGGNWTTLRLGPFYRLPELYEEGEGYARSADGRASLGEWNESYWQRVSNLISYAQEKGLYVEVDLVDGWVLKDEVHDFSPWLARNNSNRLSIAHCDLLQKAPHPAVRAWVEKAVGVVDRYPNVVYQIGNETGVCVTSREWEEGIVQIIREAGSGKLIGTNAEDPSLCPSCSYDSYHFSRLCEPSGRPCQVNEWEGLSPDGWAALARSGRERGIPFHMWRSGSWTASDNQRALQLLRELVR